ncbi:MFS transporter [Halococcus agarilyticus]|uniref:MFS transporter n=1 Tax=Halococcus agarilyticus TaxID=1232219 RepID=UPI000677F8A1|nr:MFS transporter [Halococcus agarilyticus]
MASETVRSTRFGSAWRSPTVLVIFASTLLTVMGVSLISPALPTIQAAWGISAAEASLLISAYTLPGVVLTPFVGLLADRIGRRSVLVPSLFVFGLAGGAIVFVGDFRAILGLRALQGVAGSAATSLTVTLLGDLFSGGTRNRLIGLNAAILAIGAAGYPIVGGALAAISWAAPFACFGLGVIVAIAGAAVLDEPTLDRRSMGFDYVLDAIRAVPGRTVLSLYVALFGIFVVLYGAQLTAIPFVLDERYGLSPGRIGLLIGLPAVTMGITSSQAGRLLRHASSIQLVPLGFVVYGVGLVAAGLADSLAVIAVALLLFGVGQGLAEPITDTALNAVTPDEFRGGIMSLRTSVLLGGTTVGPPVFVGLGAIVGYAETLRWAGIAAFCLGVVAVAAIARR